MKKTTSTNKFVSQWDLYRDGVTQSLIAKFLICRHRFWIRTVRGLDQDRGFDHKLEYGSMFHAGLEAFAAAKNSTKINFEESVKRGVAGIERYARYLQTTYPNADISFWRTLAVKQFPLYAQYWKKSDTNRQYILQEQVFRVPFELPSGRTVEFRGKIDELFLQNGTTKSSRKNPRSVLQENKIKGEVDDEGISTSLHHDLQTMSYMAALNRSGLIKDPCTELLYNVVKRPNGGRFPLRQKKDESKAAFATRIIDTIADKPAMNFYRWNVTIQLAEIKAFEDRTLIPILEQMCDWWDSIKLNPADPWFSYGWDNGAASINHFHFCRPFGVFDALALGTRGDYFDFLVSGGQNTVGLKKSPLFQELTNASLSER